MADTIRGSGLFRADRALAALVEDPQRLDLARERFSESPPSYRSHLSHNSTRSQSPHSPSKEQRLRDEHKWKLIQEHGASYPSNQLKAQKREEIKCLNEAAWNLTDRNQLVGKDISKVVEENVKKRWVEQGIWNEKWKTRTPWRWKHEEPLDPDSEPEADSDAGFEASLFYPPSERPVTKPRQPRSAEELQQTAQRRLVRNRQREASRPYSQFIYQMSKERERIQNEISPREGPVEDIPLLLSAWRKPPFWPLSTSIQRLTKE